MLVIILHPTSLPRWSWFRAHVQL